MFHKKGLEFEAEFTKKYHCDHLPLLISPQLLRKLNLGQIDAAKVFKCQGKSIVELVELKTSIMPTKKQFRRLMKTREYLSWVFEREVKLKIFCQKEQPSLF